MSDEMLVRHCSPTLAGIKTGNLFNCSVTCRSELIMQIKLFNNKFKSKDLRILPLRIKEQSALLYLYRPKKLCCDLSNEEAVSLLRRFGYGGLGVEQSIVVLIGRLNNGLSFPHEIGLFLGYPPEDVQGFVDNNAKKAKYVGYWKVYSDVEEAQRLFEKYKKCTDNYINRLSQGNNIEGLIV